jgi:hypothetical protein
MTVILGKRQLNFSIAVPTTMRLKKREVMSVEIRGSSAGADSTVPVL